MRTAHPYAAVFVNVNTSNLSVGRGGGSSCFRPLLLQCPLEPLDAWCAESVVALRAGTSKARHNMDDDRQASREY